MKAISPSWERVDIATIFFMSDSLQAKIPAISEVLRAVVIVSFFSVKFINRTLNRDIRYTPAVTKVEEWTRDETGVGAAIAAGSQAEKGTWALFVKAPLIIKYPVILLMWLFLFNIISLNITAMAVIMKQSPSRLVKIVTN